MKHTSETPTDPPGPMGGGARIVAPRASAKAVRVLAIAGLEPEGRAGLLADVQAIRVCGADPVGCTTAITAQPRGGKVFVQPLAPDALAAQLDAATADGPIAAVKLGMLGHADLVRVVSDRLFRLPPVPVVIDPVLATSSGAPLFVGGSRRAAYRELARARPILTPNLPELGVLTGQPEATTDAEEKRQAELLLAWGVRAVLVKGGHREDAAHDLLVTPEGDQRFEGPRLHTSARGKGCRLASALAAYLALGEPLPRAVELARELVRAHLLGHPA